jgi:hypothetical protein
VGEESVEAGNADVVDLQMGMGEKAQSESCFIGDALIGSSSGDDRDIGGFPRSSRGGEA